MKLKDLFNTCPAERDFLYEYSQACIRFIASPGNVGRMLYLRPSQLPFCPIGFFVQHASRGLVKAFNMRGEFYVRVGTAVHEAVQTYLSHSGKFMANWKCLICGRTRKLTFKNECCGHIMQYHEIEINHKGVVGHIDAIFIDRDGKLWVIDFKTTSVRSAPKKQISPPVSYVEQVETYALYMWLEHRIKIHGIMLAFIRRDNPVNPYIWKRVINTTHLKEVKERTTRYKQMHQEVLAVNTLSKALALEAYGLCKNEYCPTCRGGLEISQQLREAYIKGKKEKRLPLNLLKDKK